MVVGRKAPAVTLQRAKRRGRGCLRPPGQRGKRQPLALCSCQGGPPRGAAEGAEAAAPQEQCPRPGQPCGRSSPGPPRLSQARRAGAAAESLSPLALRVSCIHGPAGLTGFSGTQIAIVNEIRSPQITDLCRTL